MALFRRQARAVRQAGDPERKPEEGQRRSSVAPLPDAPRRPPALLLAVAAGLCWAAALALLLLGGVTPGQTPLAPPRVAFYALVLLGGLLTFVPVERQMRLPGLALEGTAGAALLFYTLAFVPPPNGWLLALPETPVYVLLAVAVFWCVSAVAAPLVHALGQVIFRARARQYDLRRARRQAREVGVFAALCIVLAGLRVLTLPGVGLVALILIVVELLFLSFIEAES